MGLANRTEDAATVTLPDGSLVIAGGSTVNDGGDGKLTAAYRVTY